MSRSKKLDERLVHIHVWPHHRQPGRVGFWMRDERNGAILLSGSADSKEDVLSIVREWAYNQGYTFMDDLAARDMVLN